MSTLTDAQAALAAATSSPNATTVQQVQLLQIRALLALTEEVAKIPAALGGLAPH